RSRCRYSHAPGTRQTPSSASPPRGRPPPSTKPFRRSFESPVLGGNTLSVAAPVPLRSFGGCPTPSPRLPAALSVPGTATYIGRHVLTAYELDSPARRSVACAR